MLRWTEKASREMDEWGVSPEEYCNITEQNWDEIIDDSEEIAREMSEEW